MRPPLPSPPPAEGRAHPSPHPPPEDPERQPGGGKRLRLGEPGLSPEELENEGPGPRSQRRPESAHPRRRERGAISTPEFPAGLDSSASSVQLKETAKRKSDPLEACARDCASFSWSPNRHDVKKKKLEDDKRRLDAEKDFSEYCESNHQFLSNQNTSESKKDLFSLNCDRSSIKCDIADSEKNFTVTLRTTNREEAGTNLDSYVPSRFEKSPGWDCNMRHILKRNKQSCWVMKNYKTNSESIKRSRERLNLLQLQAIELLGKEDYHSIRAVSVHEQQLKPLMIEMLGNQKFFMNIVGLNSKGENDTMLQLRYRTIQKDFRVSNIFQSLITEIFYFHESISGKQKDNRILSWCQILKCKNQIDTKNLITRSIYVNIKSGILSKYIQSSVSGHLNSFKTSIAYMFNNFDALVGIEDDSELEEGYIFKRIVHLNYSKLITVEGRTIYIMRTLTFSKRLKDMKPMLKKRKPIFKTQQIVEGFKKENFDSFSATTKNLCFSIFKTYEKIPFLMDFDDMEELSLIKKSSYENMSCLEQHTNVDTWAHCSFSTVKTHVKSAPQLTQKNYGCISAKCHEISMHNQNLGTERKQDPKKVSSFNSKHTFGSSFNVRQQATLASQNTVHSLQINSMTVNQVLNFESLQSEIERTKYDFILKKEVKVTAQSSIHSYQVCIKIEKEEDSFFPKDGMLSMQSISLRSKKVSTKETKSVNQSNTVEKNEYRSILQESELANSKHFHPKNDATLYVNHQFETGSNEGNNEYLQNLTAKCLSTEALTIVKDFEMKSKFDLVLKELRMFHEISKENEIPTTVETNTGQQNYFEESNDDEEAKIEIEKDLKLVTADTDCASPLPCDIVARPNIDRRHKGLFKWKTVPNNGEQEVPNMHCCPRTAEEEICYFTSEQDGKNSLPKRSSLLSDEYMEEKFNYLPRGGSHFSHGISRIQPLKTCSRPIRIGLSRKARFKQLHPYLK
ncbi:PREDICTED: RAD51-associated protein 2 [Chinchilla lanigera]|uniref:RAD51-associated protein 2 n=1 Tax=Chinchilla lanigera TaxID=34839 RepID=UPI0006975A5F|nr:PREDICTED: RAD51-associated protein 2 [Chinchilla lanigera]